MVNLYYCQMNTRNSSIELLRILAIVFIGMIHTMGLAYRGDLSLGNFLLGKFISAIGNTGVTCFILISGYFGIKFKLYRFLQLCLLTTLYSVVVEVLNNRGSIDISFFKALFVLPLYKNWFMTCYLITMLLSSYINDFVSIIKKERFHSMLMVMLVLFSILPTFFNTPYYTVLDGGGKNIVYFLFVYLIGRYMRQYYNQRVSRKACVKLFVISSVVIMCLNFVIYLCCKRSVDIFSMDCSPFILLSSLSIFLFCTSFSFTIKSVNWIASSVFAVFLLDGIRGFIDNYIDVASHSHDTSLILYIMLEVMSVFTFSLFIDKLRIFLFGKIEDYLLRLLCIRLKRYIIS